MPIRNYSVKTNAMLNIVKQCCAIIFPLITFPYVSRALGVEGYGIYNFSASIISYVSLLAGLGVSSYAIREGAKIRDDKEKFLKFANEVFSINVVSTLIAYMCLAAVVLFWNKLDSYRSLIAILSINVMITTLGVDWINTLYEDFLYLTVRYVVCQSIAVVATILFVKGPDDLFLYCVFSNLGSVLANCFNIYYIRDKLSIKLNFTLKMNARQHLKPIMLVFGNVVSSMIYMYSDTTMLGVMAGDAAVGFYSVASKIYILIKQLVNSISGVLTPRLSYELQKTGNINDNNVNSALGALTIIVFPIVTGLVIKGKEIIILIAGEEYVNSYTALAILSFALVFSTYACIFVSVVMLSQRKDKEILFASTLSATVNVLLNLYLIPKYSFNAAAFTTLVSEMLIMVLGILYTKKSYKLRLTKYLFIAFIGVVEVLLCCFVVNLLIKNPIASLMVSIAACGIVYGATLVMSYFFCKNISQNIKLF